MRTVAIASKLILDGFYDDAIRELESPTALVYQPPRRSSSYINSLCEGDEGNNTTGHFE